MAIRRCPQCGATVEADAKTLSTTCAFCDSPLVDSQAASEPVDRVATFVVPRERAANLLTQFLAGQWLAPESIRKAARADELNPVLVPFYAYDAVARTRFSADIGIHWTRTETYTTFENGKLVTKTRTVTETEWFPLQGTHGRTWVDHLVSASRGLAESEANQLEPFDLGKTLPFAPELAAGVVAEHPTIPHDEARQTARQELAKAEANAIAHGHLPGDKHNNLRTESTFDIQGVRLLLLPVWIAAVRGPNGPLRLLVNGQTGEVVGDVPKSKAKIGCLVAAILGLIVGAVLAVLMCSGGAAIVGNL